MKNTTVPIRTAGCLDPPNPPSPPVDSWDLASPTTSGRARRLDKIPRVSESPRVCGWSGQIWDELGLRREKAKKKIRKFACAVKRWQICFFCLCAPVGKRLQGPVGKRLGENSNFPRPAMKNTFTVPIRTAGKFELSEADHEMASFLFENIFEKRRTP